MAADRLTRIRIAAGIAAVAACLPYAALKIAWLAGSSVGSATAAGAGSLHDGRHTVGNAATLAMALAAVLLALALTHRRGQRLPAAVVLIPVWVGTGLLAPIALGLPVGLVAQAFVGGSPAPADNELQGWVYAVVYGGFVVQAIALLTAFVLYARVRWPELFRLRTVELASETTGRLPRFLAHAGASAAAVYAVTNLAWAVAGESLAAPPDLDTAAQRSVFASTGLLALAGAWAVQELVHRRAGRPFDRLGAPLAIAGVGSAACFASGFAAYALAADASVDPSTSVLLALGSISGLAMGTAALLAVVGSPSPIGDEPPVPSRRPGRRPRLAAQHDPR
jgi:hypothetical protein